ncbi:unnamed protein product [Closterium sp. NIES-53]
MAKVVSVRADRSSDGGGGTGVSQVEFTKTSAALPAVAAAAAVVCVTETGGTVDAGEESGVAKRGAGSGWIAEVGREGTVVAGSEGADPASSERRDVGGREGAAVSGSERAAVAAVGPSTGSDGTDPSRHTPCDQGTRLTRCRDVARKWDFRSNDSSGRSTSQGLESKAGRQPCKGKGGEGGMRGGAGPKQSGQATSTKAPVSTKASTISFKAPTSSNAAPSTAKAAPLLGRPSGPSRVPTVSLHECPVFHPSPEEFADPLRFIARVRPIAEPCGMCRIVPPPGWDPPFALDRAKFRFRTKVQALHQLQRRPAPADPATFALDYLRFLADLRLAHPPALQRALARAGMGAGKKGVSAEERAVVAAEAMRAGAVDICALFHAVQRRGGFARVSESRAWGDVLRSVLQGGTGAGEGEGPGKRTSMDAGGLKAVYRRWRLDDLEAWREAGAGRAQADDGRNEAHGETGPAADGKRKRQEKEAEGERGSKSQKRSDGSSSGELSAGEGGGRSSSHWRAVKAVRYRQGETGGEEGEGEGEGDGKGEGGESEGADGSDSDSEDAAADAVCERCRGGGHEDQMLLCDRCDRGWHLFCLSPPLSTVPPGTWFCQDCVARPHDTFGFTSGGSISIAALQRADHTLRERLFGAKLGGALTPAQLEEAFWRVVDGAAGPVETLYGSDIDTGACGSGFPRRGEPVPAHAVQSGVSEARWREYAEARWNVNNMARDAASVLRYVEDAIPGVIVPWLYMGMTMSAFCWHFEDHCFYSINYLHWYAPSLMGFLSSFTGRTPFLMLPSHCTLWPRDHPVPALHSCAYLHSILSRMFFFLATLSHQ